MAKGYSIRRARNYWKIDGQWKLHSSSIKDDNYYTRTWPTVEDAKVFIETVEKPNMGDPDVEFSTRYWKIYQGNKYICTIE